MSDMVIEYEQRRFNDDEFIRMCELGILDSDERLELVDGLIVRMPPNGLSHGRRAVRIIQELANVIGDRAVVASEVHVHIDPRNVPGPDIVILDNAWAQRDDRVPPSAVLALIEIAVTSLARDTKHKSRLYARARIPDYFVVDVANDVLLHYSDPHDFGYESLERHTDGTVTIAGLAGIELRVAPFLNPRP